MKSIHQPRYSLERDIAPEKIDMKSDDYLLEYVVDTGDVKPNEQNHRGRVCIFPPILVRELERFMPVSGTVCLRQCIAGGKNIPWGLIVGGVDDRYQFLCSLIYIKNAMGGFNVVEKAIALKKLFQYREIPEGWILELLGVPVSDGIIRNFLILSEAPGIIKELVFKGLIHENTAFVIFRFPREDWHGLAKFISGLALGTKKRNTILTMLFEISERDGRGVMDILNDKVITKILKEGRADPVHRAERLFTFVEKLRYPVMYNYRERFREKLREVGLSKDFHIVLPENFEKWEFRLMFTFSSLEDFRKKIEKLNRTAAKKSFSELLSMRY
ncbi:MAG: hypothetical protein ACUVWJ_04670 [Spirochaetota bacterium]